MSDAVIKKLNNTVWKFATNHLNVALILSIGIIPSANILGKKYYKDGLSWFDGYIPVFKKVPHMALDEAIEEDDKTLKPCVISFKKGLINHMVHQGFTELPALFNGSWSLMNITDDNINAVEALLIPAPISLAYVDKVLFKDIHHKQIFEDRILDGVNGLFLKSQVSAKEFAHKGNQHLAYYQSKDLIGHIPAVPSNFEVANAITAVINHLAMLSITNPMADKLLMSLKGGDVVFDLEDKNDQLLSEIALWIRQLGVYEPTSSTGKVFIRLCHELIGHKHNMNYASPKDIILVTLEELSKNNEQSLNFIENLKNYLQFSNHSLDQLLDQYPRALQRAIILFIAKDDVLEVWNKVGIYRDLEPFEVLLASILFAVSRGWQGLAREFKDYANHALPMQNMLASFTKNISIQNYPQVIDEFDLPLLGVWQGNYKGKLKQTVLALIEHYGLDCAEDEIILPEGVQLHAKAGRIVVKTKAQSIKINTIIDESKFLAYLSSLNWFDFEQDKVLQKLTAKK